jgi:deazaflavin-dependent oxidoreductase (nitroreductase family)
MQITFIQRGFLSILNRYFIVPAFRRGLGKFISNPITGSIMVLKTMGRKTRKNRYTPVNYALIDGSIYCYQGRHLKGKWYLNILANPQVEVLLPDSLIIGFAEEVSDPQEAMMAVRQILKNSGLGGFIYGFSPFTVTDNELKTKMQGIPVIKITKTSQKASSIT